MKIDVAVIGAGPGGYATAIRLNQKGFKAALFEKEKLGGECLNWGCIPTKAMVRSADLFKEVNHSSSFGINTGDVSLDFEKLMKRKDEVVEKLTTGLQYIFQKRKIPVIMSEVSRISKKNGTFLIETRDNAEAYEATYVVLATGSKPMELPGLKYDAQHYLSSRDIVDLKQLPEHMTIIGGGTIGCEFASIFSNLGVKIEIVELLPSLLANEDKEIARKLTISFKKKKIAIHTKTKVDSATVENGKLKLTTDKGKTIITDKVLISTGRIPTCNVDLQKLNVKQEKGKIIIDDKMETAEDNIFAIGDVTGKMMLAHTATKQGLLTADIIEKRINQDSTAKEEQKILFLVYSNIPRCTFTDPELASVGLTEEQAVEEVKDVLVGKFSYTANGKALALGSKDGMIKVLADKKERKLLGMHIVGAEATELIAIGSIIINTGLTIDELDKAVYAHPTVSEIVMEAIEDLDRAAIHKI